MTGDDGQLHLHDLLRAGCAVEAPILVFPHHGGSQGAPDVAGYVSRLVEHVRPRIVVFSIGRSRGGTLDPTLVGYLRREVPEARIMCTQLS